MTGNSERMFRLSDPDDGEPLPPPGQENILPAALFAASAAAALVLAAVHVLPQGLAFALPILGAAAYLVMLARGVWLVRPRSDGERWCRRLLLPVQLQALLYAASTVYTTTAVFRDEEPGRVANSVFGLAVLMAFAGLASSLILHDFARRARPLALAQSLGPILLMVGASLGTAVG